MKKFVAMMMVVAMMLAVAANAECYRILEPEGAKPSECYYYRYDAELKDFVQISYEEYKQNTYRTRDYVRDAFDEAYDDACTWVGNAAEDVSDWTVEAANTVANTATTTWNSVTDWVGGLF